MSPEKSPWLTSCRALAYRMNTRGLSRMPVNMCQNIRGIHIILGGTNVDV